jgi:hypothetical protein
VLDLVLIVLLPKADGGFRPEPGKPPTTYHTSMVEQVWVRRWLRGKPPLLLNVLR